MSFEYRAPVEFSPADVAAVAQSLTDAGYRSLAPTSDGELRFLFADPTKRGTWSEDIVVCFETHSILVVIHAGGAERGQFIRVLEAALRDRGHDVRFEED